jgi:predicted small lipoprotein YifL
MTHCWPANGWRRTGLTIIAVAVLATLAACGKKAALEPPEDATQSYTYPRQYPNPATVLPSTEDANKTKAQPTPPFAGDLSPFPSSRTKTTTYRSEPAQ